MSSGPGLLSTGDPLRERLRRPVLSASTRALLVFATALALVVGGEIAGTESDQIDALLRLLAMVAVTV
jgi:hypothetical protein